ncbi:uncharacterized protein LOC122076436 [Macadamia integrifolia]|uniref:uncharacterized protein LOC122076436 n=1 Tax=Macadamia integrifolia TaxID=60698 RepID=UPI001C4EAC8B|nr:uncharacterized protein LOC122076436 [Macadamia integrifolia]
MIPFLCLSKSFHLIFLYSLLAGLHCPVVADPPYLSCPRKTYPVNSTFHGNLIKLFSCLFSNASLSGSYDAIVGNDPDRVYGLFLCLGFVSQDKCKACVYIAIQDIERYCPNSKEASVWEEYCQLSYSNQNFFGYVDDTRNLQELNAENITDPVKYSHAVRKLLGELSEQVGSNSTRMYAIGDDNYTKSYKLYGLVQCTKDLTKNDCDRCLQIATRDILSCCNFSRGARLMGKSCYLRYELYAFYQGATESETSLTPSVPTSNDEEKKKLILITVSACVSIILLGFCIYGLVARKGTRKVHAEGDKVVVQDVSLIQTGAQREKMEAQDFPLISLATIHSATSNFSNLNMLGRGGFGPVYKGELLDGRMVAVKRLSSNSEQGSVEFMNEVSLILKLQHKNLVRLLGCCAEREEMILVYEYMTNGSLARVLFDSRRRALLDWSRRYNIICGIARGVLYLHENSLLKIIHRDLKTSNVLLDQDMNPKISDFGMAKIFQGNNSEANTTTIVGTYGYMAPEYAMEGVYSIKSDVFSFGVLLLEIITGRRNAGFHGSKPASSFITYVWQLWTEGEGLQLMDPFLLESCCTSELLRCIQIGLLCVQQDAKQRPTMSSVFVMLKSETLDLPRPQQPGFSIGRLTIQPEQSPLMADNISINGLTVSSILPQSITFRFILLYCLLAVLHGPCGADPPYPYCSNVTTSSSLFQYNLNNLFSYLSSNASLSIFKNSTIGNETDTVYGLFLCLGFVSLDICRKCVDTAIQDIIKLCPNNEEATVWEEYCQLRYSNKSFFGYTDDAGNLPLWNRKNISDPNQFSQVVRELLNSLLRRASFDPSTGLYATGKANLTIDEKVYGLVQCTRDLSGNDCLKCLRDATNEILSCCYFYRGARLLSKSCYLRYELYAFYEGAIEALRPPPPSTGDQKRKISTKILSIIIVSICVAVAFLGSFVYCLVAKGRKESTVPETSVPQNNTVFSNYVVPGAEEMEPRQIPFFRLPTIYATTDKFSDSKKLGQGGFGPVFKGTLPDGREVAIKRLSISSEQGSDEFMNEAMLIMRLQHKNLVRLLGCCIEGGEKILVYEYMPNSSLDVVLFDPSTRAQLHWRSRFNIIVGIARGILYLHEDSRLKIIHRDLKPSNVLLDQEMNPKISDFGIARIFCGSNGEKNTARIVGTYGYMAPEFAMHGVYSTKSDVFSFGVILLETVTGRRNAGFHGSKLAPSLLDYAWQLWSEGRGLELLDPFLLETYCSSEFLRCINVGLLCVQEDPMDRPNMSNVVVMMRSESLPLPQPQKPAFSVSQVTPLMTQLSINWLTVSDDTPR